MPDPETVATGADSPAVPQALPVQPVEPVAAPAAAEAPAAAPAASHTDSIVDLWFAECIQGSEIGRITAAYNAAYSAIGELKRRLNQEN